MSRLLRKTATLHPLRCRVVTDQPIKGIQPRQECHNKVTQLTYSKSNNTTEEGENPECRRKSRHQMNYTANKTTKEKRPLPAKLVRKGTHNNTANEKTGEDD